jgi:hypothetical protein
MLTKIKDDLSNRSKEFRMLYEKKGMFGDSY